MFFGNDDDVVFAIMDNVYSSVALYVVPIE